MLRKQAKKTSRPAANAKVNRKQKKLAQKTTKRSKHSGMSIAQALTGKSRMKMVPLTHFYNDESLLAGDFNNQEYTTIDAPKVATLRNGMKVITTNSLNPQTNISLSVDVGSRFENQSNHEAGITNFLQRAILRSTTNRVTGTLFRDMAKLGATLSAQSSRENLFLSASSPTRINPVLGAMADLVKAASYDFVDFRDDLQYYMQDSHHRAHFNPEVLMNEVLHQAAFGNVGLGQSMYMNDHDLAKLAPKNLKNWHNSFFVAKRMTIGAVGVDHDSFVRLADEMFGGIAEETVSIENEATQYFGGNIRLQDHHHHGPAHVSFAWNAPSMKSKDIAAAQVINNILGGQSQQSRVKANILGQSGVHSAESFLSAYTDSGLIGVYATVDPKAVHAYAENVLSQVAGLPDTVSDEQVSIAKKMVKSQLFAASANPANAVEDMARQLQVFGEYKTPALIKQVEALTTADIKNVANAIFRSEQPITVATLGDVSQLPRDVSIE